MSYFTNFKTIDYDLNGDGVMDNIVNLTNIVAVSKSIIDNAGFYSYVNVLDGERPEQFSHRIYGSTNYYWTFLLTNPNIKNVWNDWPMSSSQLQEYVEAKYEGTAALCSSTLLDTFEIGDAVIGVLSGATATIKEIHVNNGYIVLTEVVGTFKAGGEDLNNPCKCISISTTGILKNAYAPKYHIDDVTSERTAQRATGTSPYTHYNWEVEINDNNRNLKIIKPEMIIQVVEEFKKEIAK